jgi:hypothetical protein
VYGIHKFNKNRGLPLTGFEVIACALTYKAMYRTGIVESLVDQKPAIALHPFRLVSSEASKAQYILHGVDA